MWAANFEAHTRSEMLLVLGGVLIVVVVIHTIPGFSAPFRKLYTFIHEAGHVVALVLTGSSIRGFRVHLNSTNGQAGVTEGAGLEFNQLLISPAGYVGTAMFSAGLILLSSLPYLAPYTVGALGVLFIFVTVSFGYWRSCFTMLLGLSVGVLFIGVAWQPHLIFSIFLLNLVAVEISLQSLLVYSELAAVVRDPTRNGDDATKMAALFKRWPFRKPMFWVNVWKLISVACVFAAVWFTWIRTPPA